MSDIFQRTDAELASFCGSCGARWPAGADHKCPMTDMPHRIGRGAALGTTIPPDPGDRDTCAIVLDKARQLTGGERAAQHGDKTINHENIAALWSAWLSQRAAANGGVGLPLSAHDVAVMMVLLKVARTLSGNFNLDDYVDMAGYAGVAAEVYSKDKRYGD